MQVSAAPATVPATPDIPSKQPAVLVQALVVQDLRGDTVAGTSTETPMQVSAAPATVPETPNIPAKQPAVSGQAPVGPDMQANKGLTAEPAVSVQVRPDLEVTETQDSAGTRSLKKVAREMSQVPGRMGMHNFHTWIYFSFYLLPL